MPEADGRATRASGGTVRQRVRRLAKRMSEGNDGWRVPLFETIAEWPLAEETVDDRDCVYFIGGEAFDWRTLADRLLAQCGDEVSLDEREELFLGPDPPAGLSDDEFRRLLGVDKYRAHLNYLYGVTVEQGLILAVEEEIRKRLVGNGYAPNDDSIDQAYVTLYRATRAELLEEFRLETGIGIEPPPASGSRNGCASLTEDDSFTYWLFKRRFMLAEPARLASDTGKALGQLERMRQAQQRRLDRLRQYGSIPA